MYTFYANETVEKNVNLNCKNMIIKYSWPSVQNNTFIEKTINDIVDKISLIPSDINSKESLTIIFVKNMQEIVIINFFKSTNIVRRRKFLIEHFSLNEKNSYLDFISTGSVLEILHNLTEYLTPEWKVHSIPKSFTSSSD